MATATPTQWTFPASVVEFDAQAVNDSGALYTNTRSLLTIYQRAVLETEEVRDQYIRERDSCVATLTTTNTIIVRLRQEKNSLLKEKKDQCSESPQPPDPPPVPPATTATATYQRTEIHPNSPLFDDTRTSLPKFLLQLLAKSRSTRTD